MKLESFQLTNLSNACSIITPISKTRPAGANNFFRWFSTLNPIDSVNTLLIIQFYQIIVNMSPNISLTTRANWFVATTKKRWKSNRYSTRIWNLILHSAVYLRNLNFCFFTVHINNLTRLKKCYKFLEPVLSYPFSKQVKISLLIWLARLPKTTNTSSTKS